MKRFVTLLAAALCAAVWNVAVAQVGSWAVKPSWVGAHESFLASDALAGRGSATRDEHIAATYVASQFEAFGLLSAPSVKGYLQQAEVIAPELDSHAVLYAGDLQLAEGTDFTLVMSTGEEAKGRLEHASLSKSGKVIAGSRAELVPAASPGMSAMQAAGALRQVGACFILVQQDESTRNYLSHMGGRTRVPVYLAGHTGNASGTTLVALFPEAYARLAALKDSISMTLTVHPLPNRGPRGTWNAIGWLPGRDPAAGTLLLTAHLDHLGTRQAAGEDQIYNGADDDAAGTTAVLELAHALAGGPQLRRNVLFVCYGSEEIGELGSTFFAEHPPVPLKSLVANLEFEMIGNQDPKMPPNTLLLTGWERSDLGPTLRRHGALVGPDPYPEEHFFERSDNYSLALRGVVAHTAAGWGTVPTYHRPDDDLAHLDLQFMTAVIQSMVEPIRWLASSNFVPRWRAGGRPTEE